MAREIRRCDTCGARLPQDSDTCIICGAQAPAKRLSLPSIPLLPSIIVGLVMIAVASLWFLSSFSSGEAPPFPAASVPPTATPTTAPILATPASVGTPTPTATISPTPQPENALHTVRPGDTLSSIAIIYGTSIEAIMAANDLQKDAILSVGQQLIIPLAPKTQLPTLTPSPTPASRLITHTVESGDTLLGIAARYGSTVEEIMRSNGIGRADLLRVGQVLVIVSGTPAPTPTITMTPTPTRTPLPPYPAPSLLAPKDGKVFKGEEANILLNWTSVGLLEENEWYLLTVNYPSEDGLATHQEWTKGTSWRLPASLRAPEGTAEPRYEWIVVVVRPASDDESEWELVSLEPELREFYWR
jgi:LysM repeat protein